MTVIEAARVLGLAPSTLRHQVRNRKLKAIKMGGRLYVSPEEVERYRVESRLQEKVA